MKRSLTAPIAFLLLFSLAPRLLRAQDPVAVPAAAPKGLFGGFCSWLDGCKAKCCTTPLGMFMSSAVRPMSMMTGGIIPTPCANAQQNANSAAAAIQQDAASAKARAAEARFLGTVDCHYYPEAEVALINFLRADRSECVRLAAAQSLGTGCCCSKKTIAALTLAVNQSDVDGNPAERSLRVRVAAYLALQNCCANDGGSAPAGEDHYQPRPEMPETVLQPQPDPAADGEDPNQYASYYDRVEQTQSFSDVIRRGQQAIANTEPEVANHKEPPRRPVQSLLTIWQRTDDEQPESTDSTESTTQLASQQPTPAPPRDAAALQASSATMPGNAPPYPATQLAGPAPAADYTRLPATQLSLPAAPSTPLVQSYASPVAPPQQNFAPVSPQPARSNFPPAFTNPGGNPVEMARPGGETFYR